MPLKLKTIQSRFLGLGGSVKLISETPGFIDSKPPLKADRGWRIVTGEIGPEAFHCATVPDGPGYQWKDGRFERIDGANRAALKAHFAKLAEHCRRGASFYKKNARSARKTRETDSRPVHGLSTDGVLHQA